MNNNKSYNNPESWEKIEKNNPIIIENQDIPKEENIFENINEPNIEDNNDFDVDFSEVIELTEYSDDKLSSNNDKLSVIAEYNDIDTITTSKKHEITAKNFVSKITKFILEFNDVALSEDHKKYIKQVGSLQLQHLSDLLYLTDINKQLLNNIISRINATQAEDYAIIQSYNNLANQHLKLIKELSNTYKAIPNVLKKMKAEVLCNQELGDLENQQNDENSELLGKNQFVSGKQMLKEILARKNQKLENQ